MESKNGIDVESVNYESNTTTLTNLTSYTMYAITVSAVSSGGIGPANTARARTNAVGTTSFVQFLYLTNFSFFPKKGDRSCPDHAEPKCFSPLSDDINKTAFKIKRGTLFSPSVPWLFAVMAKIMGKDNLFNVEVFSSSSFSGPWFGNRLQLEFYDYRSKMESPTGWRFSRRTHWL